MLKDLLMRKMLASRLKDLPEAERQKITTLFENNPDFFRKIADEIAEKTKSGKDQISAVMEVMQEHQSELQSLMK
ncbi:MAG TPA: hypothetical protein VFA52_01315 [Candidatus Paceibacterota bacterium]|nr:hypothetical protein [Candidatus Paceibacterota bacterium]